MHDLIYEPEEDSFLISENLKKEIPRLLKKNTNLKFLEIGVGSGINLETALNSGIKKENILGTDINKFAVLHCKNLGFNCLKSNLFENIPKQKFNVIVFNPPYLPEDKNEPENSKLETTGGKLGNELSIKFLKQALKYIKKDSIIFLITSSLAKSIDFKKIGYSAKKLDDKELFFEKLSLWKIKA